MLTPDIRREIKEEIKTSMYVLLSSLAGKTTSQAEDIQQLFPEMDTIESRPVVHPYGLCSRAPQGTNSVAARLGEHVNNRIIIGHRDNARKNITLDEGEVILYNQYGQQIRLENKKIKLGKGASEPAVLGDVLADILGKILDTLIAGDFLLTTGPGSPTAPNPAKALALTNYKTQYVTTAATNILSQETFLERTP